MQVHVCAAKAGLDQVMRVLARMAVRVNLDHAGPIADSGGLSKLVSEAERSRIEGRIPLRRVGQLGDIAEMALFLGSTRAGLHHRGADTRRRRHLAARRTQLCRRA